MYDGVPGAIGGAEADPEALKRAIGDAMIAAQRLGAHEIAGTLMGVLFMLKSVGPAALLEQLRAIRTEDADVLSERMRRAIALLEERTAQPDAEAA